MKAAAMALLVVAGLAVALPVPTPIELAPPATTHPGGACSTPTYVNHAGWDLCWQQDDVRGQGLELNQVLFAGSPVIWKIGIPFSLTHYDGNAYGPFKDTLGASAFGAGDNPGYGRGAIQIHPEDCPRLLGRGLLVNDRHVCIETRDGPEPAIAIWARYDVFNYRFLQGYVLDSRGVLEPFIRLGGMLIDGPGADGTDHFHHIYWRVDFDLGAEGNDSVEAFLTPQRALRTFSRDPLFPQSCLSQLRSGAPGFCPIANESRLSHHHGLVTNWRVLDSADLNSHGHERSYEILDGSGHAPDQPFATSGALAIEYKGDSAEIGFEVPEDPLDGDATLDTYIQPAENLTDPVFWVAVSVHHDPRDEDAPTMSYHDISFQVRPRNFLPANPGEDSFDRRDLPVELPVRIL